MTRQYAVYQINTLTDKNSYLCEDGQWGRERGVPLALFATRNEAQENGEAFRTPGRYVSWPIAIEYRTAG